MRGLCSAANSHIRANGPGMPMSPTGGLGRSGRHGTKRSGCPEASGGCLAGLRPRRPDQLPTLPTSRNRALQPDLQGWAFRCKSISDGRRQILSVVRCTGSTRSTRGRSTTTSPARRPGSPQCPGVDLVSRQPPAPDAWQRTAAPGRTGRLRPGALTASISLEERGASAEEAGKQPAVRRLRGSPPA